MEDAFRTLKEKGIRSADIRKALLNQRVELVLTAHPTQAVRRTMLQKLTTYGHSEARRARLGSGPDPPSVLSASERAGRPVAVRFPGWASCWPSATART